MPGILRRPAVIDWLSFALALLFASALLLLLAASAALGMPQYAVLAIMPLAALGVGTLLWHRPVVAVGTLFAAALVIEANGAQFPDATTEFIPMWRNLSSTGLAPLPFSPAELLVCAVSAVWCLRMVCTDRFRVYGSAVLRSYGAYLACVGAGLAFGVATGGNLLVALWEVRTPILWGAVLVLALNLIRTTRHVDALGWIILLSSGVKGVQGTWRYVVTLDRTTGYNNLLEHEEALFFPAFCVFLLLLFVFGGGRWQKRIGVCLLPFVLLADFANQRRASTAALVVALLLFVAIMFVVARHRRGQIVGGVLVAAVLLAGYAGVYWNSGSRLAQPIRAIKSQFIPNTRDESSDLYRDLENQALMGRIRSNPVLGQGYGHELPLLPGMWDARDVAPFMLYMPHNSIMWVWWRTGIAGFTLWWLSIALAITHNCQLARSTNDPQLQRWAIFAVLVTSMWTLLGFLDQGVLLSRETVFVAVVLAVPDVLRRVADAPPSPKGADHGCA
jgi:hypothetical protein